MAAPVIAAHAITPSMTYFFVYERGFYSDIQRPRRLLGIFSSLTEAKSFYDVQDSTLVDILLNIVTVDMSGRVIEERQIY